VSRGLLDRLPASLCCRSIDYEMMADSFRIRWGGIDGYIRSILFEWNQSHLLG
jgi:hypothetical protein